MYRIFVGITAVVAALILLLTQLVGGDDASQQAGEEVLLEPISFTSDAPFTESVAQGPTSTGPEPIDFEPASPGSIRSAPADSVGLYGGSLNESSCRRQQLVSFLEAQPAKARAWVNALNADPSLFWSGGNRLTVTDIRAYVFELTPVILRVDTRVTNHGYVNGQATRIQSVLQAGTAVLVDAYGVPRVKCNCGNPLTEPLRFPPVYKGPKWPGFNPGKVVIVTQTTTIINTFVLINVVTGDTITRPAGTDGPDDTPSGSTSPTPSPSLSVPPDVVLGTGDVQVTLLWNAGDDLDLHVVDPTGFELYFSTAKAPSSSPSGGQLDVDNTGDCSTTGTKVENIFWPEGGAPTGEYEAWVRNYNSCGAPASYQLRITVAGTVVHEESGSLSSGEDSPRAPFTA
jgi:Domain of unknown function (DUF6777)